MLAASSIALMSALALVTRASSVRPMMRGATRVTRRPRMKTTTMISMRVNPADDERRRIVVFLRARAARSFDELIEFEDRQQNRHDDEEHDPAHEDHQHRLHDAAEGG